MEGGLVKTYSFNADDEAKANQANEDPHASTKDKRNESTTKSPASGQGLIATMPTQDRSLVGGELRDRKQSNPFLDSAEPQPGASAEPKDTVELSHEVERAPAYSLNRKQYVASPNLQLTKKRNPLGRFLPKAFSADISTFSPLHSRKPKDKDKEKDTDIENNRDKEINKAKAKGKDKEKNKDKEKEKDKDNERQGGLLVLDKVQQPIKEEGGEPREFRDAVEHAHPHPHSEIRMERVLPGPSRVTMCCIVENKAGTAHKCECLVV